jgi:hypothetical protein
MLLQYICCLLCNQVHGGDGANMHDDRAAVAGHTCLPRRCCRGDGLQRWVVPGMVCSAIGRHMAAGFHAMEEDGKAVAVVMEVVKEDVARVTLLRALHRRW